MVYSLCYTCSHFEDAAYCEPNTRHFCHLKQRTLSKRVNHREYDDYFDKHPKIHNSRGLLFMLVKNACQTCACVACFHNDCDNCDLCLNQKNWVLNCNKRIPFTAITVKQDVKQEN